MGRITVPRYLIIIFTFVAGLWLIERTFQLVYRIADILLIFGLAWLLKLLVDPLIRRLQRWHIPRNLAIAIAYLLVIGSLISGLIWLVPQLTVPAQNVPELTRQIATHAENAALWLQQRGILIDPSALTNQIASASTSIASLFAQQAFYLAQSFLGVVGRIALVITISVYMSLTSGHVSSVIRPVIPPRWRAEFDAFLRDVDTTYSSYIRSYFYIVALGTLMSSAILFGFRVPNMVLWILFIFLLRLLPFVGNTLANALLIGVLFFSLTFGQAVVATILVLVGQMLLTNVFMPRVMGRELGINPLLVLFAVLFGARIYGVAGILFAIPAAAIISTIIARAVDRYLLPLYERKGWWTEPVTVLEENEQQPAPQTEPYPPPTTAQPPGSGPTDVIRGPRSGTANAPTREAS